MTLDISKSKKKSKNTGKSKTKRVNKSNIKMVNKTNKKVNESKTNKVNKSKTKRHIPVSNNHSQSFVYSSFSSYNNINDEEQYHSSGKQAQNQNGDMSGFKWKQKDNKKMKKEKLTSKELKNIFNDDRKPVLKDFFTNIFGRF